MTPSSLSWALKACGRLKRGDLRLRRSLRSLRFSLLIDREEIDWIEHDRREVAGDCRVGDDLTEKREKKPRAFDQHDAFQLLGRDALDFKRAGVGRPLRRKRRCRRVWRGLKQIIPLHIDRYREGDRSHPH